MFLMFKSTVSAIILIIFYVEAWKDHPQSFVANQVSKRIKQSLIPPFEFFYNAQVEQIIKKQKIFPVKRNTALETQTGPRTAMKSHSHSSRRWLRASFIARVNAANKYKSCVSKQHEVSIDIYISLFPRVSAEHARLARWMCCNKARVVCVYLLTGTIALRVFLFHYKFCSTSLLIGAHVW